MNSYDSLTAALVGHFDRDAADMPDGLRGRIAEAFQLIPWDNLSPLWRRNRALEWDFDHDPDCDAGNRKIWDLLQKIEETRAAAAPTVLDLEARDTRVRTLEQDIENIGTALQTAAFERWRLPAAFITSLQGSESVVAASGTGAPGRPSSMHLVLAELQRRIAASEISDGVRAEADVLNTWFKAAHADLQAPTARTIENRIRGEFKQARGTADARN